MRTLRGPGGCTDAVPNRNSTIGFCWVSNEKVQRTARGAQARDRHVQDEARDVVHRVLVEVLVGGVDEALEVHGQVIGNGVGHVLGALALVALIPGGLLKGL